MYCVHNDESLYDHFMLLHTAIKVLSSPHPCYDAVYNQYAKDLLILFVEQCKTLYGEWFISYNVHCLIHLADDVMRFGPLDRYSSFPFENNMKAVKAMIRKHECILAQIVRRIMEEENNLIPSLRVAKDKILLKNRHTSGPVLSSGVGTQFKVVHYESMTLRSDEANSCVILKDETVVKILNIVQHNNNITIIGKEFTNRVKKDLFVNPLQSSRLGIYSVKMNLIPEFAKSWAITDIKCKAACFPYSSKNDFAIFPLMHTEN